MSHRMATECLFSACQNSMRKDLFKCELLVEWMTRNVPAMRSCDYLSRKKSTEMSINSSRAISEMPKATFVK